MSTLDITNSEEFLAQFNEALNAAPSSRLRHIIRDLCQLLPAALPIVSDCLLVSEGQVPKQSDSDSKANAKVDADTAQPAPDDSKPTHLKSKRARAKVRLRYAGELLFHPEEAVADEKYWQNIDLWEDEEIDTEENREDHPEGFVYGCCGRHYGEEECKVGWHEEEARDRKRRRI